MAIAAEELSPEVAGEYSSQTAAGAAPGADTLAKAKAAVAARTRAQGAQAPRSAPGGFSVFQRGAPVGRSKGSAQSVVRTVYQHLPSGGQRGGAGMGIRIIWAAAAGLLVLELMSLMTGRYFRWDLKGGLSKLKDAGSYIGLYPGQPALPPAGPAAATPPAATPTAASSFTSVGIVAPIAVPQPRRP